MLLKNPLFVLTALLVAPACFASQGFAQTTGGTGTGGLGTGTGSNANSGSLTAPSELIAQPEFEDIRREVRFAGQSLDTIVHPFSENYVIESNLDSIAGGNSASETTGGAMTTTGLSGNTVQSPFGGFNDPFQQLFFSQFQTQNAIIRSRLSFQKSEFLPPPADSMPSMDVAAVNARQSKVLGNRLRSLPQLANANVQVVMDQGTATLIGTVESEARKKQLERLLNMEAGVRSVVNQLEVQ